MKRTNIINDIINDYNYYGFNDVDFAKDLVQGNVVKLSKEEAIVIAYELEKIWSEKMNSIILDNELSERKVFRPIKKSYADLLALGRTAAEANYL